jgi:hypothetical protein
MVNKAPMEPIIRKWTNEILEEEMEVVERGTNMIKKTSRNRGIPLSYFINRLNCKTRRKRIRFRRCKHMKKILSLSIGYSKCKKWGCPSPCNK